MHIEEPLFMYYHKHKLNTMNTINLFTVLLVTMAFLNLSSIVSPVQYPVHNR